MKKRNYIKPLIGILCVIVLVLAVAVAVMLDSRSPDPILGIFKTEPTEEPSQTQSFEETDTQPTETKHSQDAPKPTETTETPTQSQATEETTVSTKPTVETTQPLPDQTETTAPMQPTEKPTEATNPQPTEKPTEATKPQTTEPTEPQPTETPVAPPEELPPSVVIPPQTDPDTGESTHITFPCQVPEHNLTIEKLAAYDGMFVEDGSNRPVQGVAMLLVKNTGNDPLEYTQIQVQYGEEKLLFDISALPAGARMVVQEKTGRAMPEGNATAANAMVIHRADMEMSADKITITDNGNNTLTIENLTDKTIPTVRLFYKYYMDDQDVYVGGIAFTVRVTRLGAKGKITIQPSHYTSQSSRVVMALTYDSEV